MRRCPYVEYTDSPKPMQFCPSLLSIWQPTLRAQATFKMDITAPVLNKKIARSLIVFTESLACLYNVVGARYPLKNRQEVVLTPSLHFLDRNHRFSERDNMVHGIVSNLRYIFGLLSGKPPLPFLAAFQICKDTKTRTVDSYQIQTWSIPIYHLLNFLRQHGGAVLL